MPSSRSGSRRRRRELRTSSSSRSSSPKEKKLSVKEALNKYINKDLRIILERCDRIIPPTRSNSSLSIEPPELHIDNVSYPSPTSSISSLASRPPVLLKEVEVDPELAQSDPPSSRVLRLARKPPPERQTSRRKKVRTRNSPLPSENEHAKDGEIPHQLADAQPQNISINLNGVGNVQDIQPITGDIQVFSGDHYIEEIITASSCNPDFSAEPNRNDACQDGIREDNLLEIIRTENNHLIGYRVSDSQKQLLHSEEMEVDQDDDNDDDGLGDHQEEEEVFAPPPPLDVQQDMEEEALPPDPNFPIHNEPTTNADYRISAPERLVVAEFSKESTLKSLTAQPRSLEREHSHERSKSQPPPSIPQMKLSRQQSSQPVIPFSMVPVGGIISAPPITEVNDDRCNQNNELLRMNKTSKQLSNSGSGINGDGTRSSGCRQNPIVFSISPQPSTSKSAYMSPPPALPVDKIAQQTTNLLIAAPAPLDPTRMLAAQNGTGTEDETTEEENEEDLKIFCDFEANRESAQSVLYESPPSTLAKIMWHCCVLWDSKVLQEFQSHEEMNCQLYTSTAIGKLITECLQKEGHSWPGVAQMNYKKPFIVLDIINNSFGTCGSHSSLRVQEVEAADTTCGNKTPQLWELVVLPECRSLANEMVRLSAINVKTTVILWGAQKDPYAQAWDGIEGEILLKPTNLESDVLSVLIFHHEKLSKERGRYIHGPFPESELWDGFQNPDLEYRTLIQVELDEYPTHLSLHAQKMYNPLLGSQSQVSAQDRPISPINLFPDGEELFEEEEELGEEEEVNDSGSNHSQDLNSMDEEDWDEFMHTSPSKAGSPTPPETVFSEERAAAARRDMEKLAERMFARPHYVHSSEPNPVVNEAEGNQEEIVQNSLPDGGMADDVVNGDIVEPVVMVNGHANDHHDDPADEIEDDIGIIEGVSDSQRMLLLSQEMVLGDTQLGTGQQPEGNNEDNQMDESFVTCNGSDADDTNDTLDDAEQIGPVQNGVVIQWGVGKPKAVNDNHHGNGQIKVNGNDAGTGGGGKNKGHETCAHAATTTYKNPVQQELLSFSETSEQYKLSDILNEL